MSRLCPRKTCYLPRWTPLQLDPARTVRRNSSLGTGSTMIGPRWTAVHLPTAMYLVVSAPRGQKQVISVSEGRGLQSPTICRFDTFKPRWEYLDRCGACSQGPCNLVTARRQILYGDSEEIVWAKYDESWFSFSYQVSGESSQTYQPQKTDPARRSSPEATRC